jgi:hypothetical protein
MSHTEDNKCLKCLVRGICCNTKLEIRHNNDAILLLFSDPCQYLNKKGICTVYAKRKEVNPLCKDIEEVLRFVPMCNYHEEV